MSKFKFYLGNDPGLRRQQYRVKILTTLLEEIGT